MKVIAIDDEPLALKQLTAYIKKIPFLELAGECQNAIEAKEILENEDIDAMFCDINMPDLNGMDFVKSLAAPPLIVFTTAYSEYAVEGFKVNAVDYLLKPFGLNEFKAAANKLKDRYEMMHSDGHPVQEDSDTNMFLKTDYKVVNVDISDIFYIEGMSEYLRIYFDKEDRKPIIVLMSMKKMEERLPAYFMRIHRSYIVNLKKIKEVNKNRVIMDKDTYLPIGEMYKEAFTAYLNSRFLGK